MKETTVRNWIIGLVSLAIGVTVFNANVWAQNIPEISESEPQSIATEDTQTQFQDESTPSISSDLNQSDNHRSSAQDLKAQINQYFYQNPALGEGKCAAYIKVLDSERVLYSYNGSEPLAPASNMKVVTTATALDMLGPDYRFKTEVWGDSVDENGIINGNLYLRGNGDPSITPPYWETATTLYEKFADELIKAGVKEINGDIVGDDSIFDRQFYPEGWADHYHLDSYSAPVSGLSLNGNLVGVKVTGSSATTIPLNNHFEIAYDPSGAIDTAIERQRGSNIIKICGPLSEVTREITVDNPPIFATSVFANVLAQRGIKIAGNIRLIRSLGEPAIVTQKHLYASESSPSLKDIITEINQQSDNFLAEHVFRTIGSQYGGQGTAKNGESCVKKFLKSQQIDASGLHMVDGCGLSTLDRITPAQLVDTLVAMGNHKYANIYKESLASNDHGTMRYRFPGIDVHGKTGTLDHYTALSGYVTNTRGQVLVFSMLFNNLEDISVGIDIQNRVVALLAQSNELL